MSQIKENNHHEFMNSLFRCRSTYSLFYPLALPASPLASSPDRSFPVVRAHVHNFPSYMNVRSCSVCSNNDFRVCRVVRLFVYVCVKEFGTSTYNQIWCGKQTLTRVCVSICVCMSASANECWFL